MELAASHLADLVGGDLHGPDVVVTGVQFDSRQCVDGDVFLALVAERDGHDFAPAALQRGAVAVLGQRAVEGGPATTIVVDDTEAALRRWADAARTDLAARDVTVVGVTGSVGKTSTKDLIAAAVGAGKRVHVNPGSFNNELGVPLTLVRAPLDAEVVVCEMGARGIGHIAELATLVRPTIGVVTAVASAHSSEFGSIEAIEQAKGEMVECLPPAAEGGVAVLNHDDVRVRRMTDRTAASVRAVGLGDDAPGLRASDVVLDDALRARFTLHTPEADHAVALGVAGAHMVTNALLALAVAEAVGVELALAVGGLADAGVSRWRMQVDRRADGVVIINDAYNANPTSMRAALASLLAAEADRRIAIVGTMAELGPEGPGEHAAIAAEAAAAGIEVVAVAEADYGDAARHVADAAAARAAVEPLGPSTAVLVKGSRSTGLEALATELAAEPDAGSGAP